MTQRPVEDLHVDASRPGSPRALGPIGVLAVQGSFALHARSLQRLEVPVRLVRKPPDLDGLAALILPGGESTVMALLLERYDLFEPVRDLGREGLPLFGTCAGAILLGYGVGRPRRLELAPVELERNAYGSQVDSFSASISLIPFDAPFHGIFIRAPRILRCGAPTASSGASDEAARVLGTHHGYPVLVRAGNLLLSTFHPELTDDLRVHRYFLETCVRAERQPLGAR